MIINDEIVLNYQNYFFENNHEIAGPTNCETMKCGDPLYCISSIFDKCPDRVMTSIPTKQNILQKTLFHRICSKFIKV